MLDSALSLANRALRYGSACVKSVFGCWRRQSSEYIAWNKGRHLLERFMKSWRAYPKGPAGPF